MQFCQQAPGLDKDFLSKPFLVEKGRCARGWEGLRPSQPGSLTPSSSLSVQLSLLFTAPPSQLPPLTPCPRPLFPPSPHHHPVLHVKRSQHQAEKWPAQDMEVTLTPIVQAAPTAGIPARGGGSHTTYFLFLPLRCRGPSAAHAGKI